MTASISMYNGSLEIARWLSDNYDGKMPMKHWNSLGYVISRAEKGNISGRGYQIRWESFGDTINISFDR